VEAPKSAVSPSTPSCSEVVQGVTVCLAAGSQISSKSLEGVDRSIELKRGLAVVALVPQPPGTTFSVATSSGKVTAVGTIFSVEVGNDGASVVRVVDGRVVVRASATGTQQPLNAGETLRIGDGRASPLTAGDRERNLALLPVSARVHDEASTTDSSVPVPSGRVTGSSQQQLLEEARALRASGEFRKAAELYRKINGLNPTSASGGAALVAQGEILLSSLNDAQGALNAFDAYLARGGPLAQEALFGKARALRALRRTIEERKAIERFIATYPDAPQGRVLRRRLAELE
jgi:hypothetical protein